MEHIRINDKIRLEEVKLSMAKVIFEAIEKDRDYLKPWLPFIESTRKVSDTEAFIKSVSGDNSHKDLIYSIWYKEEFAGLIGFKDTDWINRKTEIGYWIAKNMQGKGIVTICVKKLLKFAFSGKKLNRIQIKVAEKNVKSESIPIRLGFTFEGVERAGEWNSNTYLNLKVYSLLKAEYLK